MELCCKLKLHRGTDGIFAFSSAYLNICKMLFTSFSLAGIFIIMQVYLFKIAGFVMKPYGNQPVTRFFLQHFELV